MRLRSFQHIILFFIITSSVQTVKAQNNTDNTEPKFTPLATLLLENGNAPEEEKILEAGESYTGSAPLEFEFSSNPEFTSSGYFRYEWSFAGDENFTTVFLTRFDEVTTYTFDRSGTYFVRLLTTDTENEKEYNSDPFVFNVTTSELKVPNAFSPNGDGVNDVFKVTHRSLVRFNAYVFNRWGQEIYRWNLNNIDEGWDGTSKGKQVKNGVYFISIEAEGADGVKYNHKGDINILR